MAQRVYIFRAALLIVALIGFITTVHSECTGVCVPLSECEEEHFGGNSFFDIRVGDDDYDDVEAECKHYLEVCCAAEKVVQKIPPVTQGPDVFVQEAAVIPPGIDKALVEAKFGDCGIRNTDGAGFRITHATHDEAEFGEFPWMVMLFSDQFSISGESERVYLCGGSLIGPNVVLTAAHCVFNRSTETMVVRAGEWDTKTEHEVRPYQEQRVDRVVVHENFNAKFLFNDIAVIILQHPFAADEHIQLACLPPQGEHFDDDNCFATGWGKESFESKRYQVILKKIKLPIVDNSACQAALRTTRLGKNFRLHDTFVCAGGVEGVDTCTGDGGSPLVCPFPGEERRYYQAGIVAWGIGCGQQGIPGVYVKSSIYVDWINHQLISVGFDVRGDNSMEPLI